MLKETYRLKELCCCFTGHRKIDIKDGNIKNTLLGQIERMIERGVVYFYCGGAVGFDTLAAMCVIELRKKYRHIRLIMALPCTDQSKNFTKSQKELYTHILSLSDEIIYTSNEPYKSGCMYKRNRYMVDSCSYCICYIRSSFGGTKYTLNYAKNCGIDIVCI